MNTIQQISLKLQMGIHPAADIKPEMLRAMWCELSRERFNALQSRAGKSGFAPLPSATSRAALQKTAESLPNTGHH
jgi:hypothetical protein